MQFTQLLDAIYARNMFSLFAVAFRQQGLDVVGRGWANTRTKIEELYSDPKHKSDLVHQLHRIYIENILYSNKAVMLWSIDRSHARNLVNLLDTFVEKSKYSNTYPYPLAADVLLSGIPLGVPTAVHGDEAQKTLVYASWRSRMEEESVSENDIPSNYRDAGYTEMVVKKKSVYQVFDSITIRPDRGLVELRIDSAKTLSEKEVYNYRLALINRFNESFRKVSGVNQLLTAAINLVPALVPLYNGRDWVVSQIEHVNEGGYNNSNRGRRRSDDVRKDHYHKNGEAAVTNLQLWNVNAVFRSQGRTAAPQLILEGHSSMLNSLTPFMDLARINDCSSKDDYEHVFSALLECLSLADL